MRNAMKKQKVTQQDLRERRHCQANADGGTQRGLGLHGHNPDGGARPIGP